MKIVYFVLRIIKVKIFYSLWKKILLTIIIITFNYNYYELTLIIIKQFEEKSIFVVEKNTVNNNYNYYNLTIIVIIL